MDYRAIQVTVSYILANGPYSPIRHTESSTADCTEI